MTGVGIFWMFVAILIVCAAIVFEPLRNGWTLLAVSCVWVFGGSR